MILSVSRYTAYLEEQKERDAQLQMQIAAETTEAQIVAEPTAQVLNSDAEFEKENADHISGSVFLPGSQKDHWSDHSGAAAHT